MPEQNVNSIPITESSSGPRHPYALAALVLTSGGQLLDLPDFAAGPVLPHVPTIPAGIIALTHALNPPQQAGIVPNIHPSNLVPTSQSVDPASPEHLHPEPIGPFED